MSEELVKLQLPASRQLDVVLAHHPDLDEHKFASARQTIARLERERGHAGQLAPWGQPFSVEPGTTDETFELRWPWNLQIYDRMRKSDGQVHAVFRAATLPIRRTPWRIAQGASTPEITKFVADSLGLPVEGSDQDPPRRLAGRFNWKDHLRLALLQLVFGHMIFEVFWDVRADDDGNIRAWFQLAERMPTTVAKIRVSKSGELEGIEQFPWEDINNPTFDNIFIPVDELVYYCNDREGADWTGTSIFRSAYKHWMLKERLYRTQTLAIERNGMGVPIFIAPPGASETDIKKGHELAMKYRAGEAAGGAIPNGSDLRLKGVEGSLPDALPAIEHHDEAIARNILAQYLNLGETDTGSRALGEAFIDNFTESTQAVLEGIQEQAQVQVVETIVEQNFPGQPSPLIEATEVGAQQSITAEVLTQLVTCGALTMDDTLERFIRRTFRLPKMDAPRPEPKDEPDPDADEPTEVTPPKDDDDTEKFGKSWFKATNRREPLTWEEHVDFRSMQDEFERALEALVTTYIAARATQMDDIEAQIKEAVVGANLAVFGNIDVPANEDARRKLRETMQSLAENAAIRAVEEARVSGREPSDPLPLETVDKLIESRSEAVADLLDAALAEVSGRRALMESGPDVDAETVAKRVRDHVESLKPGYLYDQLSGGLTAAQNTGRLAAFSRLSPERIYASELLDTNTCDPCRDVDGREYSTLLAAEMDYPTGGYEHCQGGPRCRGTLVAVYQEA